MPPKKSINIVVDEYIKKSAIKNRVSYDTFYKKMDKATIKLITDVQYINEDPDLYIEKLSVKELQEIVEISSNLYHNDEGSGLTDYAYDAMEYHLRKKQKAIGLKYDKIGAPPVKKIQKQLRYPMPSLPKIKPGKKLQQLLLTNPSLQWSVKLNGVSGMAIYENGQLVEINTRGDGTVGGDISYLIPYLNIPKIITITHTLAIRGEFIMTKENARKHKCEGRAYVSGKLNSGFIADVKDIDFIVYQIVTPEIVSLNEFNVVDRGIFTPKVYDVIFLYKEKRESSLYDIDGLVLATDTQSVAFKMMLESQQRNTKVVDVNYSITRHGRYFPVIVYKPIYLDRVRITRATGHNAKHIRDWGIHKGQEITVIRMADTIPQIKNVGQGGEPILPPTTYPWKWKGCDIVLEDVDNPIVHQRRLYHFFSTIGLKQFGEKTAQYMYEAGLTTAMKVINASVKELMKVKGIGVKKANDYHKHINNQLQSISPDNLIEASSLCVGLGKKSLKIIFRHIPNLLTMTCEDIINHFKKNKIPGFAAVKIKKVIDMVSIINPYITEFNKEIQDSVKHYYIKKQALLDKTGRNPSIKGKHFVLTGFMLTPQVEDEIENYILDHQGIIDKKLSKDSVLICGQIEMNSKIEEAGKLHLPIYTVEEFKQL